MSRALRSVNHGRSGTILGGPGPPTVALPDILTRRLEPLAGGFFCRRNIETDALRCSEPKRLNASLWCVSSCLGSAKWPRRCRRGLVLPGVEQWPSTSSATKEAPPLGLSEHSPPAQLFWQRSGSSGGSSASGSRLTADHMNPTLPQTVPRQSTTRALAAAPFSPPLFLLQRFGGWRISTRAPLLFRRSRRRPLHPGRRWARVPQ